MKTFRGCLCLLLFVACVGCKSSKADFTPYIQVSHFYLNPVYAGERIVSAQDTLHVQFVDGTYVLDTIAVGDTVACQVFFGSYANELIATRVVFDTLQLDMRARLSQELQNILLPASNLRTIQLMITPGFNGLSFPLTYSPLKEETFPFSLIVESDSEFSPSTMSFLQPVR